VLILGDFKSFAPEVLILVGLKLFGMRKMREFAKISEVLILVDFKSSTINRSEKCGKFLRGLIVDARAAKERWSEQSAGKFSGAGVRLQDTLHDNI
jgi:hypothetical protein